MDSKYNIERDYKVIMAEERKGPQLTLEQINAVVSNYPGGGDLAKMLVRNLQREGWIAPVVKEAPAKPAYLPIKRKVRVRDLEPGCVLRYCGSPTHGTLVPEIGALVKVTEVCGSGFSTEASGNSFGGSWSEAALGWEFVSNPNYVHGFRIGETVYSTGGPDETWGKATNYGPYTVEKAVDLPHCSTSSLPYEVQMTNGCKFPASLLTRDPTKACNYKAPVEYKVKDGVAKEGDTIWWLASYGDPEKVIVGGLNWGANKDNVKGYPEAYQLREPQKVWDYKVKPVASPKSADWKAGDIIKRTDYQALAMKPGTECEYLGEGRVRTLNNEEGSGNYDELDRKFTWVRRP